MIQSVGLNKPQKERERGERERERERERGGGGGGREENLHSPSKILSIF